MVINYGGELREAQVLMACDGMLRLAVERCEDAVELNLTQGTWMSEEQEPVSFEFLEAHEIPLVFPEAADQPYRFPPSPLWSLHGVGNALRC